MDKTLSGATIPSQSKPGSNGNEGAPLIRQTSRSEAPPSDCLVSYTGHSLRRYCPSAEMPSVYPTALSRLSCVYSNTRIYVCARIFNIFLVNNIIITAFIY